MNLSVGLMKAVILELSKKNAPTRQTESKFTSIQREKKKKT